MAGGGAPDPRTGESTCAWTRCQSSQVRASRQPGTRVAGSDCVDPDRRARRPRKPSCRLRRPGGVMATDDTFAPLMARCRSGEDVAAREVFGQSVGRLVARACGRINRLLAREVNPEDVESI